MKKDKMYSDLEFTTDFTVEDWNALIKLKLGKYFSNNTIFEKNKEVLRTEIVNYIKISQNKEYLNLLDWTYNLYCDCIKINEEDTLKILSKSFDEISNTDYKWMTNVLTQPDYKEFSERDKINFYFKIIDETLEGVYKPRLKLLDKLVNFKVNQTLIDNSTFDFGKIITDFEKQFIKQAKFYLEDPIYSISTSQWRNIAAHKSYKINKEDIIVEYGKTNKKSEKLEFENFYKIVYWTQDIYRVIRLSQVLIHLNYMEEIVVNLGGIDNLNIRYESSLFHLIHNMQIVGFEFVSTEENGDIFCLNLKEKRNETIQNSIIHASQCLDQLSFAIYDDKFVRDNFKKTRINILNNELIKVASATILIETALKKGKGELTIKEYIKEIHFE